MRRGVGDVGRAEMRLCFYIIAVRRLYEKRARSSLNFAPAFMADNKKPHYHEVISRNL